MQAIASCFSKLFRAVVFDEGDERGDASYEKKSGCLSIKKISTISEKKDPTSSKELLIHSLIELRDSSKPIFQPRLLNRW
jgi:hypothetical protein